MSINKGIGDDNCNLWSITRFCYAMGKSYLRIASARRDELEYEENVPAIGGKRKDNTCLIRKTGRRLDLCMFVKTIFDSIGIIPYFCGIINDK